VTDETTTRGDTMAAGLRGSIQDPYPAMTREELRTAMLEGSGRALAEWGRRGEDMPTVDRAPVWLP
jgi:hypothetical protein